MVFKKVVAAAVASVAAVVAAVVPLCKGRFFASLTEILTRFSFDALMSTGRG